MIPATFKPIDDMWERIRIFREESDTALFYGLLSMGELVVKLTTAGFVSGIDDDPTRHRYRQVYSLVHADGIGKWADVLQDTLTGPASASLFAAVRPDAKDITQKCGAGCWQYEAVEGLDRCLAALEPSREHLPTKVGAMRWFSDFATLRNETRGHGALPPSKCSQLCPDLEASLRVMTMNLSILKRPWVYLHRCLSGKYRVTPLTPDADVFQPYKSSAKIYVPDGIYVWIDRPALVELAHSDQDISDLFLPNGAFRNGRYELLSYLTGNKQQADGKAYLAPVGSLPKSETHGLGNLEPQGGCWGNLPPAYQNYVPRSGLEKDLREALLDMGRHPIITLYGRGGIGKTWLALRVLHDVAGTGQYEAVFWFSARDIDLLADGPRLVSPHTLTKEEMASEFAYLLGAKEVQDKKVAAIDYFAQSLTKSPLGKPFLFVFDNFETTREPVELFSWIDTYIRTPNKVLITCRFREFKADYPLPVEGMDEKECDLLIESTAKELGIMGLITPEYRQSLFSESGGHPYVLKVLIGEVARVKKAANVERIIASKDNILDVLFDRTYERLSPSAKRVFLTLCHWRSAVPQVALQAVLLRPQNESMNADAAIEELHQMSLIEAVAAADKTRFLSVPLAAFEFGRRKLAVSAMKTAVEADTKLLQMFGAACPRDVDRGLAPRVERLIRAIAERVAANKEDINEHLPMLEFMARKYPPVWLMIATLHEESEITDASVRAKEAVRHYLETQGGDVEAWKRLAQLCYRTNDWLGEAQAYIEMCARPGIPFKEVSESANRINSLLSSHKFEADTFDKEILCKKMAEIMASRISEGSATDCSRLAWLYMNLQDATSARKYAELGMQKDPNDSYCWGLLQRIGYLGTQGSVLSR